MALHTLPKIPRNQFLKQVGVLGSSFFAVAQPQFALSKVIAYLADGIILEKPLPNEDIFAYIRRIRGTFDQTMYRQIVGCANPFKEGDAIIGVAAHDDQTRQHAQYLLGNTKIEAINAHPLFEDALRSLIQQTTTVDPTIEAWTLNTLKAFLLTKSEMEIKAIMPNLTSDAIACVVKLLSNEALIQVSQKIFNPLPNSHIGSKGYLSARIQPNSPTDSTEDIIWQVFDAWSFGVGDLLLGTNPVSSAPESVAAIERALYDILTTFQLQDTLPNCVLAHIDIQAQVEEIQPGTTGIWFQSIAGSVDANKTFDLSIEKMFNHIKKRTGRFGLYAETGQGADATNGHAKGVDMVIHESRKYGFVRALKAQLYEGKLPEEAPWVFVNDVAGFIGPEVFRTKEQLVRCCLEDTVMGKLHGLTIGLDVCSTLHMDITMDDLDWCIHQIMPANPAYLMALPTKNDPMLSYLTTAFADHVRIREMFQYKVDDAMWAFFKDLGVIGSDDSPTEHFGDPIWVYYQYRRKKNDTRTKAEIYAEGRACMDRIQKRGVPIAEGHGTNPWDLNPALDQELRRLYADAKDCLWTEMSPAFAASITNAIPIITQSKDRVDYVYHPESGEQLSSSSLKTLEKIRKKWKSNIPDFQVIISDGLNVKALTDEGHLAPFLSGLYQKLSAKGYAVSPRPFICTHGRVRAGYRCGEVLFGHQGVLPASGKGIIHIIGERPGSGHHTFSAYITVTAPQTWMQPGKVDHNITRVVSGISDTSLLPVDAVQEAVLICDALMKETQL